MITSWPPRQAFVVAGPHRAATTLVFLLPASGMKNAILRRLGHRIGEGASIGPTVVLGVERIDIGARAVINFANTFRRLRSVVVGADAHIGQFNWISSDPGLAAQAEGEDAGSLVLGAHAAITARHAIDCSGGVRIGEFALVAGWRSTLMTHWVDYRAAVLRTAGIRIEPHALVSSDNKLVPGAHVPARSVTAMGSVVLPGLRREGQLYAGVPARPKGAVHGAFFGRTVGPIGLPSVD